MSRAAGAAALGAVMALVAAAFDTASLYLPGLALLVLGLGSALWVGVAARAASVERLPGPHTVEEEQPYPLRLELRTGLLPLPAGELRDPLRAGSASMSASPAADAGGSSRGSWSSTIRCSSRCGG
jgi:uncharacterized protein (DUF58 family)